MDDLDTDVDGGLQKLKQKGNNRPLALVTGPEHFSWDTEGHSSRTWDAADLPPVQVGFSVSLRQVAGAQLAPADLLDSHQEILG